MRWPDDVCCFSSISFHLCPTFRVIFAVLLAFSFISQYFSKKIYPLWFFSPFKLKKGRTAVRDDFEARFPFPSSMVDALVDDSAIAFVSKPARCIGRMIFPKEICLWADFPQTVLLVFFPYCIILCLSFIESPWFGFHLFRVYSGWISYW